MTLRYILRNVSKYDIHFVDLNGYVLHKNKAKNLFDPGMRLSLEKINKSKESGTIKYFIDKKMVIEVLNDLQLKAPPIVDSKLSSIKFPQRTKSLIVVAVNRTELDQEEEQQKSVISDEDKLLEEMEESNLKDGEVPIIRKNKDDKEKDNL